MGKLSESQKKKRNFRKSKSWLNLRHIKYVEQDGKCPVCGMKLGKTANLHHLDMNESHYSDISKKENFVFLCHSCHEYIHYKYKAFTRGDFSAENLEKIWTKMMELN